MKFIMGRKKEMTQIFTEEGKTVPVAKIEAGPCFISEIKKADRDGYEAIQLAFIPKKKGAKPQKGQLKGIEEADFFQYLREFRVPAKDKVLEKVETGQKIRVDLFEKGEKVKITGISKGKGFQGVVKRHGFSGSPASHGHKDQLRMPGSIGATGPAHVFKGMRMPGQMGNQQSTTDYLEIIDIDPEKNILFIKGAVPGAENGLLLIKNNEEFKIPEKATAKAPADKSKDKKEKAEAKEEKKIEGKEDKKEPVKQQEKKESASASDSANSLRKSFGSQEDSADKKAAAGTDEPKKNSAK